jgi:hypothetical protein
MPRALFLFPENESVGLHSPDALPWTRSISGSEDHNGHSVLLIALNMTSSPPRFIYIHLNAIPIARFELQLVDQQRSSEELMPLECSLHNGSFDADHAAAASAAAAAFTSVADFLAATNSNWSHVLACSWAGSYFNHIAHHSVHQCVQHNFFAQHRTLIVLPLPSTA